ncbi:Hypothetical protein, predicted lipoprotein [Metamycoplasma auris 15026]|uniref:Lipoprotein n=1 Tax=Metamycoplasma auris 15026 TaxID=1188233 RepID=N9VA79_9BACT|nr:hypothetical protein [Metamycoplasma auris]ENY68593.1 Hypothetical protein, predicted lipoprotein [Metamycoplasma auris 15026]
MFINKKSKAFISLGTIVSFATFPLISSSCKNKKSNKNMNDLLQEKPNTKANKDTNESLENKKNNPGSNDTNTNSNYIKNINPTNPLDTEILKFYNEITNKFNELKNDFDNLKNLSFDASKYKDNKDNLPVAVEIKTNEEFQKVISQFFSYFFETSNKYKEKLKALLNKEIQEKEEEFDKLKSEINGFIRETKSTLELFRKLTKN